MFAAWIALAGTVLGASLSMLLQRLNVSKQDELDQRVRTRNECLVSYSEFAGAVVEYRRAQLTRRGLAFRVSGPDALDAAADVRRSRAAAWTAFFRVKLVTSTSDVESTAAEAMALVRKIQDASSLAELEQLGKESRTAIDVFAQKARDTI